MKLIKLFAESGASAVHLEDQLHGGKKCGHQAGKVLVPTSTHITRLIAARFQLDILESTMLLIARTDSESGKLISSSIDSADHEFIMGTTKVEGEIGLAETLDKAERAGKSGSAIDRLEKEWMDAHPLVTFDQAVQDAIASSASVQDKENLRQKYLKGTTGKSNSEARAAAKEILGFDVVWDWDREFPNLVRSSSTNLGDLPTSTSYTRRLLSLHWRTGSCNQTNKPLCCLRRHAMARNEEARLRPGSVLCSEAARTESRKVSRLFHRI